MALSLIIDELFDSIQSISNSLWILKGADCPPLKHALTERSLTGFTQIAEERAIKSVNLINWTWLR